MKTKEFSVVKFDDGSVSIATSDDDIVNIPGNFIEPLLDALKSMMLIDNEGFAIVEVGECLVYECKDNVVKIH